MDCSASDSDTDVSVDFTDEDTDAFAAIGFGIAPYSFDPSASSSDEGNTGMDDTDTDGTDGTDGTDEPEHGGGGNDWCRCDNCIPMATARECLCCRQLRVAVAKQPVGCIVSHPYFHTLCLDTEVLNVAYHDVRQNGEDAGIEQTHKRYRYVAYRQFTRWTWGYLGKGIRKVLPSCVVKKIRDTFPADVYSGFRDGAQ